jgi:hypothetical protein
MCSLSPTVPVRKKGITSVLLSSFANKDTSKIERVTFDNRTKSNAAASSEFYIGKVSSFSLSKHTFYFKNDYGIFIWIFNFHSIQQL